MGVVRWAFDLDPTHANPDSMHREIQAAVPLWRKPLGCGVQFIEVPVVSDKPEELPDLIFRCETNGSRKESEVDMTMERTQYGWSQAIVRIDPARCATGGRPFALHAVGHGLGFQEEPVWGGHLYPEIMDKGIAVHNPFPSKEKYYDSINGRELDALRIWALEQGAPGCGADDPLWSWEDPNLGYTYSAGPSPEMLHYIQLLKARAKN